MWTSQPSPVNSKSLIWQMPDWWKSYSEFFQMAELGILQPSCEHLKLKRDFCDLYFTEHHNPVVNILLMWRFLLVWHILRWTSQTSAGPYREHLNQVKICQIMFICQSPCRQEHPEMQQAVGDSCEIIYACQAWWCLCLCLSQNATDVIRVTLLEFR